MARENFKSFHLNVFVSVIPNHLLDNIYACTKIIYSETKYLFSFSVYYTQKYCAIVVSTVQLINEQHSGRGKRYARCVIMIRSTSLNSYNSSSSIAQQHLFLTSVKECQNEPGGGTTENWNTGRRWGSEREDACGEMYSL